MSAAILILLGLAACTEEKETPPSLSLSVESLDLGAVPLGGRGEGVVSLTNDGGGAVEVRSLSIEGGDLTLWEASRSATEPLEGGDSVEITVAFTPEDEGLETARLLIRTDLDGQEGLTVSLAATGAPSTEDSDGDGHSPADGDCDDDDPSVHPGADEACDGRDNDCDGVTPADEADNDYDGARLCSGDCDDTDPNVSPSAVEICDGKDSNCDGVEADNDDNDGDSFSLCDGDCDDTNADAHPGAAEVCDGLDNDCSGGADDLDADGDGHTRCGAAADCDDLDARAHPVWVRADGPDDGSADGTEARPYPTLADGLAGIDATCRAVVLAPGRYEASLRVEGEDVSFVGAGLPEEVVWAAPEGGRPLTLVSADVAVRGLSMEGGDTVVAGDGGAILATDSALSLTDVSLRDAYATGDGGALALASSTATLSRVSFSGNTADDDGGAIAALASELTLSEVTALLNTANRGGALLAESSHVTVTDSAFSQNTARSDGGAVALTALRSLHLSSSSFLLNSAGGAGGALRISDSSGGHITACTFQDNTATTGGGLSVGGASAAVEIGWVTVTGGRAATTSAGGGVQVEATDASGVDVHDALIVGVGGVGLWMSGGSARWVTAYLSSSGEDFGGPGLPDGADSGEGNRSENPLLCAFSSDGDPSNDALGLRADSPARDSGDPSLSDADGSRADRGATGGPGGLPLSCE